jgi:hypothetical protein
MAWPEDLWGNAWLAFYYLSLRALSQRTQLPNKASLIACGMPVEAGSIAVFKIPIHTPPRCGPERKTANAVEGSAPIGAGARAVNLDGARGRQLRLIFDPIRGPND